MSSFRTSGESGWTSSKMTADAAYDFVNFDHVSDEERAILVGAGRAGKVITKVKSVPVAAKGTMLPKASGWSHAPESASVHVPIDIFLVIKAVAVIAVMGVVASARLVRPADPGADGWRAPSLAPGTPLPPRSHSTPRL